MTKRLETIVKELNELGIKVDKIDVFSTRGHSLIQMLLLMEILKVLRIYKPRK